MGSMETEMPNDRPAMSTTSTTNGMLSNLPSDPDRMPTAQTAADSLATNDMTMSSMNTMSTNPSLSEKPNTMPNDNQNTQGNPTSTLPNGHTMTTTNIYSNTVDITKMPNPPTMMTTTTMDRFPSTAMSYGGSSSTDLSTNEIKPPTYPSIYVSDSKPDDFSYPYPPNFHNKPNYYHEVYPIYTYPSYYDSGYSGGYMPNSAGSGYAQNTPTVGYPMQIDHYGTTSTMNGYGAVGSTSSTGGGSGSGSGSNRPNTGATYMGNGWSNVDHRKQGERYPDRDNSGSGYPEGKYNGTRAPTTIPYIRTYFNPDFYLKDTKSEYKICEIMMVWNCDV